MHLQKTARYFRRTLIALILLASPFFSFAQNIPQIAFPVDGSYVYRNDWHEPRGGGARKHMGTDIIADKMTPLVAVTDGYISFVARPEARWGYEVEIQGDDGYFYDYLHINNDTPGTDDGIGTEANAYPAGIIRGARISRGAIIGWVGDSGNAEDTVPHLHFEIRDRSNTNINPYPILFAASGGKGVSDTAPRTNTDEVSLDQRKIELRYIFTKELREESESSEVRQLQLVLKTFGHFTYPTATGYFGPVTKTALLSYQKKKNISQSGILDIATRRALNTDLGTWDPNDYIPFYGEAEKRAILIAQLQQQILILQERLRAIRGY